ncbi:long-chain fatty acid--CoA ligase [Geomonas sp. RF6]|uniref:AMP-dependent synthetase/ligase n=1 Tax=Geomonas sp. RF6 TaxID=2897342 RepID=UPI001E448E93|nr:long-chain fatty acid--CoA ligase [Geomonas sp. RF6]UFS70026.1 long-chain fatty acid--CoA ligase [Geomonas sp. RF6]
MERIPFKSLPDALRKQAEKYAQKPALKYRKQGEYVTLSYAAFYDRALMAARGLRKVGVAPGDRVAILSENRVGWVIADMGILCAGGVTVPIYATNTPHQIEYHLNHSNSKVVFVSGKFQYSKLLKIRDQIPQVRLVVSFERFLGEERLPLTSFYQLSEIDEPILQEERAELEALIETLSPDDLLTLIYTSGTTGTPKGVMLTHGNIMFDAWYSAKKIGSITDQETFLSFLPLSHIFERTAGYYLCVMLGSILAFADSIEKLPENLMEVRPTVMMTVPRLLEKIYSRIIDTVHELPLWKQHFFDVALGIGQRYISERYLQKIKPPFLLRVQYRLADLIIFRKFKGRFGGNLRFCCSGGAPLEKTINEFFWIIGLPIFEGYGLTETSPVVSINNFQRLAFGSVGTALEETHFRIEEDGEILVRGPQVMHGYYNEPEATAEAIDGEWFRTGDIGRLDGDFLYITDRKKEIIITSGGKNIPPQPIENALKLDKYISQAYVHGDRKPFVSALIVPRVERLLEFAKEKKIHYYDLEDLVMNEQVRALFAERVEGVNANLAQYERVKKFVLLPRDFSIEDGELTATLKLKRKVISEKYRSKIERMYNENVN